MKEDKYPGCQQWFTSVFSPLGVTKIDMRTDLRQELKADQVAGIYLGGGDTVKLLRELRDSGFDATLRQLIEQGIPVYGGSAGAIVLGKDIRSSPEGKTVAADTALALDVLSGHAVYCHMAVLADAEAVQKDLNLPVIALPERAGVYLDDQKLEAIGFESVWILDGTTSRELKPGETYTLTVG
jgi:dipeptidase E